MSFTQKLFTSYQPYPDGATRIGELHRIWYDSNTNTLRIQLDKTTPGGTIIGGGSTGFIHFTDLSVNTGSATEGGSLSYSSDNGTFTFRPANLSSFATTTYVTNAIHNNLNLGNFVVNGTNLETLSGTVNGADIILNPNNGSVQVPSLKVGSFGNVLNSNLYIEAYITSYQLLSIVDYSTTDALPSGQYGNINGVPAPWTVFQLAPGVSGVPISAIQIDDILTGVGIVPSVVRDRGLGGPGGGDTTTWNSYVIVDLDLSLLGQVLPITGAVFNLTRPLNKANFNISSATGTDILLNSQGVGDVIVNTNILPITTNISNLGSPTKRWKSIYLGPGTLYVLDETLGRDLAIGARDGLLYVQNGAGLTVGEFTFIDNQIKIADNTRDIIVGTTNATGYVDFNRPIRVKNNLNVTAFEVDRTGLTSIRTPSGINYQNATLSIIGTNNGHIQPRPLSFDGTLIQLTAQDGKSSRVSSDSFGTGVYPLYVGRAARGDVDNPSAMIGGDVLSRFSAVGYGATGYVSSISRIDAVAAENFTDTTAGTQFTFQNAAVGTIAIGLSATIDRTGVSFVGNSTGGITFQNSDRLTYFPTPVGNPGAVLASNGTTMSWQLPATFSGAVIYKGAWNANTNTSPTIGTDGKVDSVAPSAGFEYSISATGTQDIGAGSQSYATGGFIIYNGTVWEYIAPISGVASIKFDGGTAQTGAVQVQSSDITSTLDSGSIANAKLAYSSVTVTAGTGMSGGGAVSLGSSVTLNNAGVTAITTSSGLSTNTNATGSVTITNTGVLSVASGGHITATTVSGAVTLGSDATANDTANTIALRNSDGGIDAKDFTATLDASIASDHGPFNYGTLSYTDTGIMADFSYTTNGYNQIILQNRNAGTSASTNYIVSNDQGTANTYYGEFGMNSSGFSGTGSLSLPNAVYLNSVSSDLVLGGSAIHFVIAGGTDSFGINSSGVATFANKIIGSISGNADGSSGTTLSLSNHTTTDLAEGTNKYYLDSRARASISAGTGISYNSTTGVITNTITQYTDALARASISAGTGISYNSTTGVITNTITQYTDALARASISAGTGISYNSTTGVIASTITQYTDALARAAISVSGSLSYSSSTGVISYTAPTYTVTTGSAVGAGALSLSGTTFTFNPSSYVGTVTSVSASPSGVVSVTSPTTTPVITIAQANGSTSGYLSSTDWTTFNNKTSNTGTVTNVATSGTVSGITLTGGPITTTGTITLGGSITGLTTSNLSNSAAITNSQLANSTISGVALGGNLANLTAGTGITFSSGTTYNGSAAITINNSITQYTDALARASLSASTGISYNNTTGVIASTITQYTDALARAAISVSGSLSYNSGTGVISYTTPTYTVSTASASGGGALSLSGTTFTFTPASIPSYGVGGNQLVYVTNGAVTLGTTTAAQSIFGLTSGVALASNTRYIYEINTVFELTESGPGDPTLSYSLAVSGGAVLAKHAYNVQMNNNANRTDNSAGITMMSNDITANFGTGVVIATIKNTYNAALFKGVIDVTTGGNVNFMITLSKAVSALSIPQLSYITLVPVGAIGANTQAGTWA